MTTSHVRYYGIEQTGLRIRGEEPTNTRARTTPLPRAEVDRYIAKLHAERDRKAAARWARTEKKLAKLTKLGVIGQTSTEKRLEAIRMLDSKRLIPPIDPPD